MAADGSAAALRDCRGPASCGSSKGRGEPHGQAGEEAQEQAEYGRGAEDTPRTTQPVPGAQVPPCRTGPVVQAPQFAHGITAPGSAAVSARGGPLPCRGLPGSGPEYGFLAVCEEFLPHGLGNGVQHCCLLRALSSHGRCVATGWCMSPSRRTKGIARPASRNDDSLLSQDSPRNAHRRRVDRGCRPTWRAVISAPSSGVRNRAVTAWWRLPNCRTVFGCARRSRYHSASVLAGGDHPAAA